MPTRRDDLRRGLRYDPAAWRQSRRSGKEKGVHVYISGELLRQVGIDPNGPAPSYRVRPGTRGRAVFVNLRPQR